MNIRSRLLTASATLSLALVGNASVVLSNIGQPVNGLDQVTGPTPTDGHWLAAPFQTGSSAASYALNSVTLALESGGATVASGGFTVSIFGNNSGVPGSMISGGALSGSVNPSTTGAFTYTASDATLAPSTTYWVVARVATGPGSVYQWRYAADTTQEANAPGWTIDGFYAYRSNGAVDWFADNLSQPFMMAIDASPVPEPSEYASVAGVGVLVAAGFLRRRRHD